MTFYFTQPVLDLTMITPDNVRSATMRAVKSKNTSPELHVRRLVYSFGYRYRLHRKDLPGTPDLVLAKQKKVIFVHGCFWHGHGCKRGARKPKTNFAYWSAKINRNKERDEQHVQKLKELGWNVLIVWECELMNSVQREIIEQQIREYVYVNSISP